MATKVEKRPTSNVKFVHCRHLNDDGSIRPHGGMTIAYNLNAQHKVVGWAAAKCHSKDMFVKALGRMKAAGRLLSAAYYQECPEIDEKTFVTQAINGYKKAF